jgi:hypothetical protein
LPPRDRRTSLNSSLINGALGLVAWLSVSSDLLHELIDAFQRETLLLHFLFARPRRHVARARQERKRNGVPTLVQCPFPWFAEVMVKSTGPAGLGKSRRAVLRHDASLWHRLEAGSIH